MADDLSEHSEWQAIRQRDEVAFARWLARCEVRLRRSLRPFAPVVDVEAVLQETAIQIWEHDVHRIRPTGGSEFLLRWAFVVARNKALNIARREGRLESFETWEDLSPGVETSHGDPLLRDRIRMCLERLVPTLRRVVNARLTDDGQHKDRELAERLGVSFEAFRQNLARGRRALEECLSAHGIDIRAYLQ